MRRFSRKEVCERIDRRRKEGRSVVLCGASRYDGAVGCEAGGADFLLQYSCSDARIRGLSSMEGCLDGRDVNALNESLFGEFRDTGIPVIAGVDPWDERRDLEWYIGRLALLGYAGVCCFPCASMYGLDRATEARAYAAAKEHGLFCLAFVFDSTDAVHAAAMEIDGIVFHLGMEAAARDMPLPDACERIRTISKAAGDTPILIHGGPTIRPADVGYILANSPACGILNGSVTDAKPAIAAVKAQIEAMRGQKLLSIRNGAEADAARAGADWLAVNSPENIRDAVAHAPEIPILLACKCYGEGPNVRQMLEAGASGIVSRPGLGRFGGAFGRALRETGLDFSKELLRLTETKRLGGIAIASVYSEEELSQAVEAGLDGAICGFIPTGEIPAGFALLRNEDILPDDADVFTGSFAEATLREAIRNQTARAAVDYKTLCNKC